MELEEQVQENTKNIEGLRHDVDNLIGWQKSQNGTIYRVEEKVDSINNRIIIGSLLIVVAQIILNFVG